MGTAPSPPVEVIHPTGGTEIAERWSIADERRCWKRCKWCGCPIIWGEVAETIGTVEDTRGWMPLDPDTSPHVCGTERIYTRPLPIDTTRPSIEDLLAAARLPRVREFSREGVSA